MRVFIDDKEVSVLNDIRIVEDVYSPRGMTEDGVVEIKITSEGIIMDLWEVVDVGKKVAEHECTATWGSTFDELVDVIDPNLNEE